MGLIILEFTLNFCISQGFNLLSFHVYFDMKDTEFQVKILIYTVNIEIDIKLLINNKIEILIRVK